MMSDFWQVGETLEQVEEKVIRAALQFYGGNKTMTAKSLGISIRGLDGKMERFQINRESVLDEENNKAPEGKQKNRAKSPKRTRKNSKGISL